MTNPIKQKALEAVRENESKRQELLLKYLTEVLAQLGIEYDGQSTLIDLDRDVYLNMTVGLFGTPALEIINERGMITYANTYPDWIQQCKECSFCIPSPYMSPRHTPLHLSSPNLLAEIGHILMEIDRHEPKVFTDSDLKWMKEFHDTHLSFHEILYGPIYEEPLGFWEALVGVCEGLVKLVWGKDD